MDKIVINTNLTTKEYRLMYLWGAWVTKEVIFAENDAEAIFDADAAFASCRLESFNVVLFCGNRAVKIYN
jgi:hypothetical protein